MLRRVCLGLGLGSILALAACKPTIILDPEPQPRPVMDPAEDPLIEYEAVRVAVREYVAALEQRDVAAASALVVGETFTYYEDLRGAALRATRSQLENWDLMSLVLILQIRSELPRPQLERLNGRGLFAHAVLEGLVGGGLDGLDLDHVRLDETSLGAQIVMGGEPVVWLRKTDDDGQLRWRLDIPKMIEHFGPAIEAAAREHVVADGRVRTAYTLLSLNSEASVPLEVLDGPLDGEAADAP